jgi:Lysophospholipase L1 and related esterases
VKKVYVWIMSISLVFNLLFVGLLSAFIIHKGGISYIKSSIAKTGSNKFSVYHNVEKSAFSALPDANPSIIFAGDSLTDYNEWDEAFKNSTIKNRGIEGDQTPGIIDNINNIVKGNPKKIFIMMGINDLTHGASQKSVLKNYQKFFDEIKAKSPESKIYVQSILPINHSLLDTNISNGDIKNTNLKIKQLADKNNLTFIDLYPLFDSTGELNKSLTIDGVHLNGNGYKIWESNIKKYVK